jgi:type III restriction enzyme
MHLYQALAARVAEWRQNKYLHQEYPAIGEILEWVANPEVSSFRLRIPQVHALETYWYLRLVEGTPHIFDLYARLFTKTTERLAALGMDHQDLHDLALDIGFDGLVQKVKVDDDFVKQYKLEALRETLTLQYPSYILALAMGAGKTVLIGAIFASEFAMAQEYPDNDFVENALVFAPGKTIIESLRELAEMRYEAVLPPRFYKPFAASLKLTFTRDGDTTIPVIKGSQFNVIVTNTEKIRIQKEDIRKSDLGPLFSKEKLDEARSEVANLRLQAIASLPNLAIFSDEAHHTYGQALDTELKKVRKTVDYLYNPFPVGTSEHEAHRSNLRCVINTTGTPYFKHQPLRDVVIWYGLSEGIRDGILKEVAGNIQAFDFEGNVEAYLAHVVEDFFKDYGRVTLPDGTTAKLAIFFPQTNDVEELRPVVETTLARIGYSPTLILEHHTHNEHKDDFDRFKSKDSPHRVALLVDRGVEGWNVPALFACALARKLKSSNNFVLQASSRCLRQVPGNKAKARIYLSLDNRSILDQQLRETYGESITELNQAATRSRRWTVHLRKMNIPPLVVRKLVRTVMRTEKPLPKLRLDQPQIEQAQGITKTIYSISNQQSTDRVLQQMGDSVTIESAMQTVDIFTAAVELASNYHLDIMTLYQSLSRLYPGDASIPLAHLTGLAGQIEEQTRNYEVKEEMVEVALALVKPGGFSKEVSAEGIETYTAEITYPIDRQHLLTRWEDWKTQAGSFGFHYDPYNFDSSPERSFFAQILEPLQLHPDQIEDVYFTGALTDPQKTDFYVEYRGEDGGWHRYTPDFVIRRKDGKCLIIEIKREHDRLHPIDGENGAKAIATQKWAGLNPDKLKYQMIFTEDDEIGSDKTRMVRSFMEDKNA